MVCRMALPKLLGWAIAIAMLFVLAGCATSAGSGPQQQSREGVTNVATAPTATAIHTNVPRHRFKTTQKLNPVFWFGNADDPVPPPWYRPDDPKRLRRWYWRNSCHNFTFYVMGIADKDFTRVGCRPNVVFNPEGGWNWTVCRYKCVRLPCISYQRNDFKFYIGWRERGNFGVKLTF